MRSAILALRMPVVAVEDLHVVAADIGDVDGGLAGACRQQQLPGEGARRAGKWSGR